MIKNQHKIKRLGLPSRRGAMIYLLLLMMFGFIITAAFSIDVAYMQLTKTELRSATDAAAKAAADELARTQDIDKAILKGISIANRNLVAGEKLRLGPNDFAFGKSTKGADDRFAFQPDVRPINSVKVNGRRTADSLGGAVPLFFGRIFDTPTFQPQTFSTVTFLERDIVLVVDRSGSMNSDNKFRDLRDAIQIFLSILDNSPTEERVGLASYSTTASDDVQMTTDLSRISTTMASLPVEGFTNISGGMDAGSSILQNARSSEFVEHAMILLTDGIQNRGRPAKIAANDLAERGIVIHTITFGKDADKAAMRQVATIAKGRSFHASTGDELKAVFREIAVTFSTIMTQ